LAYGPAPEAAEPALDWIREHQPFGHFINGSWVRSPEQFEIVNPATGQELTTVGQAGEQEVDQAVEAARQAFGGWSTASGHARARYLYGLARAIQRNSRLFSVLESLDNGKPIRESRDIDIPLVARHFSYHAGWAQLIDQTFGDFEPVGVVGQIIPWNFPLLMLAWKIAPALAAGNTVVLKPAEFTPLTALAFAEVCRRAGLPAGVVNVVTGDGRTGELLVKHDDVDKIAFTGSTEVGRIIRRQTAGSGKRLSLELGGKSPFIVFDDADLDSVVEGLVDAIWFNQGQVCCAGSRLLVQENVEERLVPKVRARMEKLRVGDPLDKAVDIGAIVAPVQLQRIQQLVQQGVDEGATMWQPSWACPTEGYFYPPTLFTNVSPAASIAQVEIFGPVLVEMTFRTPEEAVQLANNTAYGLAASIWSENINVALDVAARVKAGTVWINSTNVFDASSGFGGYRESGYGREGGKEGMYEYLKRRDEPGSEDATRQGDRQSTDEDPDKSSVAIPALVDPEADGIPSLDRTAKLYIGGKQARPDSGYSRPVYGYQDQLIGEVGEGNRKDIRNAVEAAQKAASWNSASAYNRSQVLFYLAENLSARHAEFGARLAQKAYESPAEGSREVEASIERIFAYAAWADKFEGPIHRPPLRGLALAIPEPIGVMGLVCPDEYPLLALVSVIGAALAMGNTVVVVPSERHPLLATDLYQVLETSDVPAGAVNIVTGDRNLLATVLAQHDGVDSVWYFGDREGARQVEHESTGNMKRTWAHGEHRDWAGSWGAASEEFLREATQVKNIWVPWGA
jgi:aldehyde dehydrogenase (NAD+)